MEFQELDFIHRNPSASLNDISKFLNNVSKSLDSTPHYSNISTFTLDFSFSRYFEPHVEFILRKGLEFKIKELNLTLTNGDLIEYLFDLDIYTNRSFDQFPLPRFLNGNPLLRKMNLSMCSFREFHDTIRWSCLKELSLCKTNACKELIEKIVLGCPVLEVLELNKCWGISELNFDKCKMLKKLVLNGVWPRYREEFDFVNISAPTVNVLEILGNLDLRNIVLKNMCSCFHAKIDYYWTTGEHGENLEFGGCKINFLQNILKSLKHVKTLTCGTWFIEVISRKCAASFRFQLTECKILILHTPVEYRYQRGILHILECCSNVETLNIRAARSHPSCKICIDECIHEISNNADETHRTSPYSEQRGFRFKVLQIFNLDEETEFNNLPPFLKFLVENSRYMQEVVIA